MYIGMYERVSSLCTIAPHIKHICVCACTIVYMYMYIGMYERVSSLCTIAPHINHISSAHATK